jgi:hypothetical protein
MLIYQIRLPDKKHAEAFGAFMREHYFRALQKGPTRVGQITELVLLERDSDFDREDPGQTFFLQVGWSGLPQGDPRVDDEEVERKLLAFKAEVSRLGAFSEVAGWHNGASR